LIRTNKADVGYLDALGDKLQERERHFDRCNYVTP